MDSKRWCTQGNNILYYEYSMFCMQCILRSDVFIFYIVNRQTKNIQIKFYVMTWKD